MEVRKENTPLPKEVWKIIMSYLDENDLHYLHKVNHTLYYALASKRFNHFQKINYKEIFFSSSIETFGNIYHPFSLPNGVIAFGLTSSYIQNIKFYRHDKPDLIFPEWENCQDILIFSSMSDKHIQLKGHSGTIIHIIQLNEKQLASLGEDHTIRVWEKFTGKEVACISLGESMTKAIYLLALNDEELVCFDRNSALVWNTKTKTFVRNLLYFRDQYIISCRRHDNQLFFITSNNKNKICINDDDNIFVIFDVKEQKIIKNIKLSAIKDDLIRHAFAFNSAAKLNIHPATYATGMYLKDYRNYIAVVKQLQFTYFIDTWKNAIIFYSPSYDTKHRFLADGRLVILSHTPHSWVVLANYCYTINDFEIKFSQPFNSEGRYQFIKDTQWTILPNGNVVTYNSSQHISSQWNLKTQEFLPNFTLEKPEIPLTNPDFPAYDFYLSSLPNGDIFAHTKNGVIAIWNGTTGNLLLNMSIAMKENPLTDNLQPEILNNGDLHLNWIENNSSGQNYHKPSDKRTNMILRFGLFEHTTSENAANSEQLHACNISSNYLK